MFIDRFQRSLPGHCLPKLIGLTRGKVRQRNRYLDNLLLKKDDP